MKQKITTLTGALLVFILCLHADNLINHPKLGVTKITDLIGVSVINHDHHKVGKIKDFVLDIQSGRVVLAIVSSGGMWGWNEKLTSVVPQVLHFDQQDQLVHLTSESGTIDGAPLFWFSSWTEQTNLPYLSKVYRFYNKEASFNFIQFENIDTDNFALNKESNTTISTRSGNGTWTLDQMENKNSSKIPVSRMSSMQRATRLIGIAVQSIKQENVGKVDEILIDLNAGRIAVVMISDNLIFEFSSSQRALPPTLLHFNEGKQTLVLGTTNAMFVKTPHYKGNEWPDFSQTNNTDSVYQQYQMIPYYIEPVLTAVDNTAKNSRDRNSLSLTPMDQGTSPSDIATTQRIRKEIISHKKLSINGKNIKIITVDGQVTLRGPVSSTEERLIIGKIADRIAHEENVDNQLEVKISISKID